MRKDGNSSLFDDLLDRPGRRLPWRDIVVDAKREDVDVMTIEPSGDLRSRVDGQRDRLPGNIVEQVEAAANIVMIGDNDRIEARRHGRFGQRFGLKPAVRAPRVNVDIGMPRFRICGCPR